MSKTQKLSSSKIGSKIKLIDIPHSLKADLIRLGLCEGDVVTCIAKIPSGPVVLEKGFQEIAIGRNFAKDINVDLVN